MIKKIKISVVDVPNGGYVIIGDGTYQKGANIERDISQLSQLDPEEINDLLKKKYVEIEFA